MKPLPIDPNHPLATLLRSSVHQSVVEHVASRGEPEAENYLTGLLLEFMHADAVAKVKAKDGAPVRSVIEMVAEADVRLHAESFEREREVHKHIGDTILFWSALSGRPAKPLADVACDYTMQGQESYYVVSTFDHAPFEREAPLFRTLSEGFPDWAFVLADASRRSGLSLS